MCAWLLLMCAGRFGLGFYPWCTSHVHAYFMHTYPFFSFYLFCLWCVSSFSQLDCAWYLTFVFLSSNPPIPPLHVQFHDKKAWKDLLGNFQKRGLHLKRHVIMSKFSNTPLPTVIWTRGWEFLLEIPLRCPIVFIQEFYSNIHSIKVHVS